MEINDIKELITMVKEYDIESLKIDKDGFKLSVNNKNICYTKEAVVVKADDNVNDIININDDLVYILRSPLVGKISIGDNLDSHKPYEIGDIVSKGDVLCSIEAMKLFNEIVSEKGGTLSKIFVEDNEIVEYDQPLFEIML